MNVVGIDDTGAIVVEPDRESLFSDVLEIAAAKEHWRVMTNERRVPPLARAFSTYAPLLITTAGPIARRCATGNKSAPVTPNSTWDSFAGGTTGLGAI